jgi:hypothetical protein
VTSDKVEELLIGDEETINGVSESVPACVDTLTGEQGVNHLWRGTETLVSGGSLAASCTGTHFCTYGCIVNAPVNTKPLSRRTPVSFNCPPIVQKREPIVQRRRPLILPICSTSAKWPGKAYNKVRALPVSTRHNSGEANRYLPKKVGIIRIDIKQ